MKIIAARTFSFVVVAIAATLGSLWAQAATGNHYFVASTGDDAASGSRLHPWKTLGRAAAAVTPGATVHVMPGTYSFDGELKTEASGTPSATIRYVSDQPWGAKLRSSKTANSAVWWNRGDYVAIEGFDLSGAGALGIYNEGSHVQIIGNFIHDIPAPGCPAAGGAGILNGNHDASADDVIGNTVTGIGELSLPCARVHGIYQTNAGGRIVHNTVVRSEGWGIHLWHAATGVLISDNLLLENTRGGILVGAVASEFRDGNGKNSGTTVTHNVIVGSKTTDDTRAAYGVEQYGDVEHATITDNVVYGYRDGAVHAPGAEVSGNIEADPRVVPSNGTSSFALPSSSPACSGRWVHAACANAAKAKASLQ
jgi:Right handed beta helix region/Protein of unknown function (DUF1565)